MSAHQRIRRQQLLRQAEGYLELGMAQHALDVLGHWGAIESLSSHALYLQGEAFRSMDRFQEALPPLQRAAEAEPANTHVWLALGWCYKRLGRIDLAIEALQEALAAEPNDALIHYNLACYWSLAGNKRQALMFLSRAINMNEDYRDMVGSESDFDPIRSDPAFRALVSMIA